MGIAVVAMASSAIAADQPQGRSVSRVAEDVVSGILTPVPNPQINPCYSVVDCRRKGHDLPTVWQVENNLYRSPKEYPDYEHGQGKDGYVHNPAVSNSGRR
jgi:hypothetical protein